MLPEPYASLDRYRLISGPREGEYVRGIASRRDRGMVTVWYEQNHPYQNEKNPGGLGSGVAISVVQLQKVE